MTISAPATAAALPKGPPTSSNALTNGNATSEPQGSHNLFATVLSSADSQNLDLTGTQISTGLIAQLPGLLQNLLASLNTTATPARTQPALSDTATLTSAPTPNTAGLVQSGLEPKALAAQLLLNRPTGKKQKRADEALIIQTPIAIPTPTPLPIPKTGSGNTGSNDSTALTSLVASLTATPVQNPAATPAPVAQSTPDTSMAMRQRSLTDPAILSTAEPNPQQASPSSSASMDTGHLSFLLKMGRTTSNTRPTPNAASQPTPLNGLPLSQPEIVDHVQLQLDAAPDAPHPAATDLAELTPNPTVTLSLPPAQTGPLQPTALRQAGPLTSPMPAAPVVASEPLSDSGSAPRQFQQGEQQSFSGGQSRNTSTAPTAPAPAQNTKPEPDRPVDVLKRDEPKRPEPAKVAAQPLDELPDASPDASAQTNSRLQAAQPAAPTASNEPASGDVPRPTATPPAHAAPSVPQLPQATTASQIAIRLDSGNDSGQVELRIRERAGEVQIAVRSTDQGVATTLRQDLGDLVKRLDSHNSTLDTLRQSALSTSADQQVRQLPGADSSRGFSYFSDDAQQRQRQQQQQQRQQQHQAVPLDGSDDALEELRSVFSDLNNGVPS